MNFNQKMTAIADKIRSLTGSTDKLNLDEFNLNLEVVNEDKNNMIEALEELGIDTSDKASLSEIANLIGDLQIGEDVSDETSDYSEIIARLDNAILALEQELQDKAAGGIDTSDATATSEDILDGKTAYINGEKVIGSMPTADQAIPSINVDASGLITASSTQDTGYVTGSTKSAIKQLATQAAKTVTPTTSEQTIVTKDVYTTGEIKVGAIPSEYIVPTGTKNITTNGTHDVSSYASATVNVAGEDVTDETTDYTNQLATLETAITALETELQGKTSGGSGSVEICTVTMNTAVPCRYLGIDLQPKTETTSTFETVKNSIAVINGEIEHHDFFGYTLVLSESAATVVQLNETIVNLTIRPTSGGAD